MVADGAGRIEYDYYAKGVGLVLEVGGKGGAQRSELSEIHVESSKSQ